MQIILTIGTGILTVLYSILKLLPQQRKVTIISRQSDRPSLDITMLADEIRRIHPDHSVMVLCRKLDGGIGRKIGYCFHLLRQMYHLATSKIVVLDSYCIAASILHHKKSLLIVQMWHSIGTMKKFGYSILDKPEGSSSAIAHAMKMHAGYDYILAAGEGYKEHLADGFHYPVEQIVTLPLPRVEALKDPEFGSDARRRILQQYPQLQQKKTIVYVPTFRKANDDGFVKALADLCQAVDHRRYNLVIKAHPLTDLKDFDSGKAILDRDFSSFEMLFVSDLVISDYSCIIYEAAVLKKPIYFYDYDYEEYMSSRDIYMNYKTEIPSQICRTGAEVAAVIERQDYDYVKLDYFLNKYVFMGSQHETADIVEFLFAKQAGKVN